MTSDVENMEKSERVVAAILSQLMVWGIQDCELVFEELQLPKEYEPFFFQCLRWLEAEGIIRTSNITQFSDRSCKAINPVLTSFGIKALNQSIKLVEGETKLADAVNQVSGGQKPYSNLGDFIGGLLGGFTKSIGSG